ncbi:hypothetical protein [Paenibacillus alvei]|uniref:Uncharacterized protein n=1 Tax=Paenibacillus alvei TaxID=44250 RepID=A0AAP6ZUV0_PAEAL|nr:hypothetical protein [Paenibacillus alvei]MBG9735188.1 hypothetical protein [Paenibacillus alvei]MBG9743646.1 hypothetical protein [Paenibacillus alvei]MCY9580056.1 hypothetical protein [Paenibacillus alvei]NOJ70548.1 hypothetical protein [Paenibacillus alvei]
MTAPFSRNVVSNQPIIGSILPAKSSIQPLECAIRGVFEVPTTLTRYDKDVARDGSTAMSCIDRK